MSDTTYTASTIRDTTVVRHFRDGSTEGFLPRLNLDLGMSFSAETFLRLQTYFKTVALRDPTVGELRILNAAEESGLAAPDRIAVGELTTSSPAVAETWADMMEKHGSLHGAFAVSRSAAAATPPCTLTDALALTSRYLYQNRLRTEEDTLLLSSPAQEAVAAASGYTLAVRMLVGDRARTLWVRRGATAEESPCKTGDILLYLPRLAPHQLCRLVEEDAKAPTPALGALRAVANASLLSVICELCPAADLYVSRLAEGQSTSVIPVARLCNRPRVDEDGICGFIARVPIKQVQAFNQLLSDHGIASVACGQVRKGGNFVFLIRDREGNRDVPAATLPADLLLAAASPRLYAMKPAATTARIADAYRPAVTRYPSVIHAECGLTPDGRESVALTLHEGEVLYLPEASVSATFLTVDIADAGAGYTAAAKTVADAAKTLESYGARPQDIRLTVTLTAASRRLLTDGDALACICGVYCAAAQLALPVEDAVIEEHASEIPLRVTVTAWAKEGSSADSLPTPRDDRQWRTPASPAAPSDSSVPAYVFPVLRRSYEGCLKSLAAALNRDRAVTCSLRPLAMNHTTDEESSEVRYSLHPDSEKKLLELIASPAMPVFSMNEGDTRLLLSHVSICEALRLRVVSGGSILVLGESCKPFAELAFLPAALTQTDSVATDAARATVLYSFPSEPSARLVRTSLLTAPAAEAAPHVLTLHLPDGTAIPDGFIGCDGKVLGLCNGLDTTVLSRIGRSDFSTML